MEWDKASSAAAAAPADETGGAGEALGYVKVMTDEQMEVLRKQISIYATICEQLVEMHRALTAHQDSIAGISRHMLHIEGSVCSFFLHKGWKSLSFFNHKDAALFLCEQ
jgi:hypothetical protein